MLCVVRCSWFLDCCVLLIVLWIDDGLLFVVCCDSLFVACCLFFRCLVVYSFLFEVCSCGVCFVVVCCLLVVLCLCCSLLVVG